MEWSALWPAILAALVGSSGLAAAWWLRRQKSSAGHALARGRAKAGRPETVTDKPSKAASVKAAGKATRRAGNKPEDALDTLADWEPVATRVLNTHEREAYHVLRKALPDHMILGQVPVARFIKVPTDNPYSEWLKRVGSLCADLVVCDAASQVVAVVEVRQPRTKENERAQKRHARMDKVLQAARIPVHVWLEGALPGPTVAREAILGAALQGSGRSGFNDIHQARRTAEAAALVASMQTRTGPISGMSVDENNVDFNLDDWTDEQDEAADRKEPPASTWFDDLDSSPIPLDESKTPAMH
ncbi:MAG: hypothetical protein RI920_685 [Pseudomonadota bacterium]|jgi:hypothetical protein